MSIIRLGNGKLFTNYGTKKQRCIAVTLGGEVHPPCIACGGTGKITGFDVRCALCNGTGVQEADD